ncbi:hypothetical protein J6590_051409 [Homalodisca vitripennis]|nr:hypothetical protein J6590_051409 [Homalodisca vitripennis]
MRPLPPTLPIQNILSLRKQRKKKKNAKLCAFLNFVQGSRGLNSNNCNQKLHKHYHRGITVARGNPFTAVSAFHFPRPPTSSAPQAHAAAAELKTCTRGVCQDCRAYGRVAVGTSLTSRDTIGEVIYNAESCR